MNRDRRQRCWCTLTRLVLLVGLYGTSARAAETSWEGEIAGRRAEYLKWVIDEFGKLESDMKPLDGRAWSLNQARLFLNRDIDKASRYFQTVKLTFDADFMGIRLLKTLLDFGQTNRLSNSAKEHLAEIIVIVQLATIGDVELPVFLEIWVKR